MIYHYGYNKKIKNISLQLIKNAHFVVQQILWLILINCRLQ